MVGWHLLARKRAAISHGRTVSESGGRNYAPSLFADMPEARGIKPSAFKLAMARLLSGGSIKIENNGKKGHHYKKWIERA